MHKTFTSALLLFILLNIGLAQRANIFVEPVNAPRLTKLGFNTQSTSTGLKVVGVETYVYMSAQDISTTPQPITNAVWEFVSRPSGSTASFVYPYPDNSWAYFLADKTGEYQVKLTITTSAGVDDTTISIFSARYVGVGNFDGVPAQFPNCMTCHSGHSNFVAIFDSWKLSKHATQFKRGIDGQLSPYYQQLCFKCHTTGTDFDKVANNDGFDDVATSLGWVWTQWAPPKAGNWDSLKTKYPRLVQLATIGCESCHGPGREHTMGGAVNKIEINYSSGACGQCHDYTGYYYTYTQWESTLHANPVWTSSFAQSSGADYMSNNLNNCIRCHDGRGFVNMTKGRTTDTRGMIRAQQTDIGCPTCHDPHGNSNTYSLRSLPAGKDTLATGEPITLGGKGKICMGCHIGRRNAETYVQTNVTAAVWGPHYSTQGDVFLGKNAASFGTPYLNTNHMYAVTDGCVGCHMYETADTGNVNRHKVGEHTFRLTNPETGYEHVKACQGCHGPQITSFESFMADQDYDGDGTTESIRNEVKGLMKNIRIALPPVGIDSISWTMIRDANDLNMRKAYFNYRMIYGDASYGMHNTKFTIDVLRKSLAILTGVEIFDSNIPKNFELSQNYPNPFNPTTEIKFSIPKAERVRIAVYNSIGKLVKVLVDENLMVGNYKVTWDGTDNKGSKVSSGIYLYMMETPSYRATKKMVLLK